MQITDKAIRQIRQLTQNNDHTEAYILVCSLVGEKGNDLKEQFEKIKSTQEREGELSFELYSHRQRLYIQLMNLIERLLGEDAKRIRQAL